VKKTIPFLRFLSENWCSVNLFTLGTSQTHLVSWTWYCTLGTSQAHLVSWAWSCVRKCKNKESLCTKFQKGLSVKTLKKYCIYIYRHDRWKVTKENTSIPYYNHTICGIYMKFSYAPAVLFCYHFDICSFPEPNRKLQCGTEGVGCTHL
jgi:hypothetical protein